MMPSLLVLDRAPASDRHILWGKKQVPEEHNRCLAVCVPTFQRPHLLRLLLRDLARQKLQPDLLIVVDGDPASGEVRSLLNEVSPAAPWKFMYIPSNHANLPYQRYLGWRASAGYRWLVYLDDDLRISQLTCLNKLVEPFQLSDRNIAGVTARIAFHSKRGSVSPTVGPSETKTPFAGLIERFGAGVHTPAGGLTPSGHRKLPLYGGQRYENVDWLHGAVMAFRRRLLTADCFSEDLFALAEVGCGLGEDTILSRRAASKGQLLFAFCARVKHDKGEESKARPTQEFRLGYATALSRRLINDNFRGLESPQWPDRLALLKSYAGNILLAWPRALKGLEHRKVRYALGYTIGALRGLCRGPSARRLTPRVEWWLYAERAMIHAEELQTVRARLA